MLSRGSESERQRIGPDNNRAMDWLDWCDDVLPWNPSSTSRLIPTPGTLKVPLTPVGEIGSE